MSQKTKQVFVVLENSASQVKLAKINDEVIAYENVEAIQGIGRTVRNTRYFSKGRDIENVKNIYESLGFKFKGIVIE